MNFFNKILHACSFPKKFVMMMTGLVRKISEIILLIKFFAVLVLDEEEESLFEVINTRSKIGVEKHSPLDDEFVVERENALQIKSNEMEYKVDSSWLLIILVLLL